MFAKYPLFNKQFAFKRTSFRLSLFVLISFYIAYKCTYSICLINTNGCFTSDIFDKNIKEKRLIPITTSICPPIYKKRACSIQFDCWFATNFQFLNHLVTEILWSQLDKVKFSDIWSIFLSQHHVLILNKNQQNSLEHVTYLTYPIARNHFCHRPRSCSFNKVIKLIFVFLCQLI